MSAFEFLPGSHDGIDIESYHAMPALSSSGIKKLLRSPAHYLMERTKRAAPTDAMRFGTAVHTLVLEPDRAADVVEMPEFNNRTKDGKADRDAWIAGHAGRQVLSADAYQRAKACAAAIRAHPGAAALLSDGVAERTVLWRDSAEQIECRARFDWHRSDMGIVDLKTCVDASPQAASRAIAAFGYAVSAAHYWAGHEHVYNESPRFWAFICAESEPPHGVACYVLDAASIRVGMRHCATAYRLFRECLELGRWPSYPDTIESISLPAWAMKFNQE